MSHPVKATFNEVSQEKMKELESLDLTIEKISDTQVVIECTSENESEVRAFMSAPVSSQGE
jgi:hypothetical protein